jgi:hypothetical protein
MSFRSNKQTIQSRLLTGIDQGLIAAAELGVTTMKQLLPPDYYTGGEYSHGHLLNSIHRTEPFFDSKGRRVIMYGVDRSAMYARYFEDGFYKWPSYYNKKKDKWVTITIFPLKWYRKEIWRPTFVRLQPRFRDVYRRAVSQAMNK